METAKNQADNTNEGSRTRMSALIRATGKTEKLFTVEQTMRINKVLGKPNPIAGDKESGEVEGMPNAG